MYFNMWISFPDIKMRHSILLICLITMTTGQLTWKLLQKGENTVAPLPRRDAALGFDEANNRLVLFGGRNVQPGTTTILGDLWVYDLGVGLWREIKSKKSPAARFSFVWGVHGDFFYVSTGEGRNRIFFNDIWRFDLRNEKWEELPPEQRPSYYNQVEWETLSSSVVRPSVRYGAAGGIFHNGSRFYVTHGFAGGSDGKRYADTFSYSIKDKAWFKDQEDRNSYNPSYPHARCLHARTMVGPGELVIYGGCLTGGKTNGPCPTGDSWLFNGKGKNWVRLDGCASERIYASLAALPIRDGHRRAVLYGGIERSKQTLIATESPADQVAVINPDTKKWALRKTGGDVPIKRASAAMATSPRGIYMFGGLDLQSGEMLNDLYLLQGDAVTADKAPVEAFCEPTTFSLVTLHGIFMVGGWGFFLQWGAFIARYFRHKNPLWFNLHRLFQVFGLLMAIGGFTCAVLAVQYDHFNFVHGIIGLVVMIVGILHPIFALCRPHLPESGEPKSARRIMFELYHLLIGRLTLITALVNISLGLFLALASTVIWALWFAYLGLLVLIYIGAEGSKCCLSGRDPSPKKYRVQHRNAFTKSGLSNPVYED